MHTPLAEPRPSIYYDYRVFPDWRPPADASAIPPVPVAIVGAGPCGLVLALGLARYGVRSVVIEAERQVSEGSRAIVFTRRTLEILQQVGVSERVLEAGLPWGNGNSFYRGQRVFRMQSPHSSDERFPPMVNLQQQRLEEFLVDAAAAQPLIELRWGNAVTGIEQDDAGATLTVDTAVGEYRQRVSWVVAADGARSALRQLLNLRMEGDSYEGRFVIADIRIDLDLPTERLAFFDPPWNPGNTVLMHREPQGIWRIDYQLPAGESPEQALQPAALAERINAQLAEIGAANRPWQLDWSSVYSARTLTLSDYRCGRTLFAGDAAHILPIFGVRGANTAFQDAHNLAWKLAFVLRGRGGAALLDSYTAERLGAAREIIAESAKSIRFMTPPTRGYRLLRDAVLSLSLSQPFVGPLFHWRTARAHHYHNSPLRDPGDDDGLFATGPRAGAAVANLRLSDGSFLLDHLGDGFILLLFNEGGDLSPDVQAALQAVASQGLPLRLLRVARYVDECSDDQVGLVLDSEGRLAESLGVTASGAAYLIRPDQHVAARWLGLDGYRLRRGLRRACGECGES